MSRKQTFKSVTAFILAALFLTMTGCGPDPFYIRVALIEGVPETGEAGTPLALTGTIRPAFASNKDIIWSVKDAGTTGASISGNILNTAAVGIVTIRAIITDGIAEGKDYTQDFEIKFSGGVMSRALYTVKFETNGGGDIAPQSVAEGQTAQRPDNPVKPGFNFVNWYDNEDFTDPPYNFDTPVTADITLYAKWITIINIEIILQPAKTTYNHDDILDLSGLSVELTYDDDTTEILALENFGGIISANPSNGSKLSHIIHNNQPVKISAGNHDAYTNKLTVNKAIVQDIIFPTASAITYGEPLSASTFSGGTTGRGAFAWEYPSVIPTVTNEGYYVEFTPNDMDTCDYTSVNGWNDTKVVRLVSITINKKVITIYPTVGQSKVYGAADPIFTNKFTYSPQLISGDSFSGALSRIAGENAGTYEFTLGSLSVGSNYSLTLAGNVVFTITKASGAGVNAPVISWNADLNRIEVTAVTAPATGQTVEYAISTANNNTGLSTWQDGLNFTVSSAATYYVYARSKENTNYNAGTSNVSAGLTIYSVTFNSNGGSTVAAQLVQSGGKAAQPANPNRANYTFGGWYKEAAFTNKWNFATDIVSGNTAIYAKWTVNQGIGFEIKPDESPEVTNTGLVISRSGADGLPKTITLGVSSGYTNIKWYYNEIELGTEATLILDASDIRYNMIGKKFVRVEAWKEGIPYSANVEFEVKL